MATNENLIPIPGRLHSVATEGHVAGADEIYDDTQAKDQKTINSELIAAVGTGGSVDSRIAAAVNVEKTRAERAESTLDGKIADEQTRATNAENALDGRVDTLEDAVGTGGSVDSRISAAVATETTRAQGAESQLSSGKADKATTLAGYGITDAYTKSETYTKTEVNGLVDTPHQEYVTVATYAGLPQQGSKDTIYRVSNYDGSQSQADDTVYSEYAWDGSQYVFLCVKSQIGEVFDISVYHNNAKYATLADALAAGVPQSLQKGGMSVKFVQSSDNKYVQYRLMNQSWSTTVSDWQGVDEEPTAGSDNLVKSKGVKEELVKIIPFELIKTLRTENTFLVLANEGQSLSMKNKVMIEVIAIEGSDVLPDLAYEYILNGNSVIDSIPSHIGTLRVGDTAELFNVQGGLFSAMWLMNNLSSDVTVTIRIYSEENLEKKIENTLNPLSNSVALLEKLEEETTEIVGGNYSNVVEIAAGSNITFLVQPNTTAERLSGRLTFIVNNLEGANTLKYIDIAYLDENGMERYLNTGTPNIVKKGFVHTFYINKEWTFISAWYNGVVNPLDNPVTIDFTFAADTIQNREISSYIPKDVYLLRDDNIPFTATRDNVRIYPHNMVDVDDTDFSIAVAVLSQRSGEKFVVPHIADSSFPVRVVNYDDNLLNMGEIAVKVANPSAPTDDLFILPIGDSLMYGKNSALITHEGCINNELSRLFNGIGTPIANGAEPLGYDNIHVIGTLGDQPIKHEGRGGWTCYMYLHESYNNAFYNPAKQLFDLDYYLSQNGFYTEGVAANGSNLIIPILLNWNTDPQYSDKFETDYQELLDNIHTSHPSAKILLIGCNCPPRNVFATYSDSYLNTYPQTQAYVKKRAIAYENKLAKLAEQNSAYCYHVPILPFYNWENAYLYMDNIQQTPRDPQDTIRVYSDHVHPNLMGYGQMADIVFNAICYLFLT